jgi:hypothetical protein
VSPTENTLVEILDFVIAVFAFVLGRVIGIDTGRHRERERIRDRITTDQATGAGDYAEAENYADRMVQP